MKLIFNARQIKNLDNEDFMISIFSKEEFVTRVHLKHEQNLSYIELNKYYNNLSFRVGNFYPNEVGKSAKELINSRDTRRIIYDCITQEMLHEEHLCMIEKHALKLSWCDNPLEIISSYTDALSSFEKTYQMKDCSGIYETCINNLDENIEEIYIGLKEETHDIGVIPAVIAMKIKGEISFIDNQYNNYTVYRR